MLLRSVAQAETDEGDFAAAAADWNKLAETLPNEPLTWNALGYARSYAGDYAGALTALREYARLRPAEANPLDSMGDVNYSFRKFGEAAAELSAGERKRSGIRSLWGSLQSGMGQIQCGR